MTVILVIVIALPFENVMIRSADNCENVLLKRLQVQLELSFRSGDVVYINVVADVKLHIFDDPHAVTVRHRLQFVKFYGRIFTFNEWGFGLALFHIAFMSSFDVLKILSI